MKELATVSNNELIFSKNDQALMSQMSADCSDFSHEVSIEDITTPRLKILQNLSPEISKNDPKKIDGAEEGDILETLNKTLFKAETGLYFVPVKCVISYLEWQGTGKQSKLINNYGEDATLFLAAKQNDKGKKIGTKPDSIINKTYGFYGFILDVANNAYSPMVIPMSRSQEKKAKEFNAKITMIADNATKKPLPAFSSIYQINSVPETNDLGTFYNYNIERKGFTLALPKIGQDLYNSATEFYKMLSENKPAAVVTETDDRV